MRRHFLHVGYDTVCSASRLGVTSVSARNQPAVFHYNGWAAFPITHLSPKNKAKVQSVWSAVGSTRMQLVDSLKLRPDLPLSVTFWRGPWLVSRVLCPTVAGPPDSPVIVILQRIWLSDRQIKWTLKITICWKTWTWRHRRSSQTHNMAA
jgi:hypothetical protein